MNAELLVVYEKLEKEREQILRSVARLDTIQYNRSLHGKWSISQILNHLLASERLTLLYMVKKSRGVASLENTGWLESVKLLLLQVSQRLPLRYKAPHAIIDHTPSALDFGDLQKQWIESRAKLRNFLERIEEQNIHKKIFKHPIAGRFNVIQGLTFLHEHILHHLPQINRLL